MKKKKPAVKTTKATTYAFSLPEYGLSVEAANVSEAIKKAKKLIKER
jgi:hypothetical protein